VMRGQVNVICHWPPRCDDDWMRLARVTAWVMSAPDDDAEPLWVCPQEGGPFLVLTAPGVDPGGERLPRPVLRAWFDDQPRPRGWERYA
jgi:hypothetical protein